ncbi:MAG: TraB/GumN family protein [Longimicrobiales bacterium]|nr:TraB/GumN family protein [Longimicrobiales bacterium]
MPVRSRRTLTPIPIPTILPFWVALIACVPQTGAVQPAAGPALWQVGDEDTTLFLFGLPNLMDADTGWRNAAFDSAVSRADAVILEADRSSAEAASAMQRVAQEVGVFRDGRTLADVLSADVRARAGAVAASLGVPLQALDPLKPWLAANQLQAVALRRAGLTDPRTPAALIVEAAAEAGKPITYLEEPTTLLTAIGGLPEASQLRMFRQTLDIIETDPGQAREILSLWAAGDVNRLADAFHGEGEWVDETVRTVMLLERNAAWQARLEEILETETGVYFVAVGIGHLVGDDSLVAALEAAGYGVLRR